LQYDINSGEITQEYDQHLGPVNSITFVDQNRRFVTTSDDKTIRAWDFDIPVVIKYIAEPYMHSMPAVTLHPSRASPELGLGRPRSEADAAQKSTSRRSRWTTRS
jgi:pre-mRNA-processing factor 17